MERFLRYSLERNRAIRAVLMLEGKLAQKKITALALESGSVTLQIGTRKQSVVLPMEDILSCDYARGDHGEDD